MKVTFVAMIIAFGIGLWFGVNIGKGNSLYDNPFEDPDIVEDAHDSADDAGLIDQGREFLEEKKEQMKDKVQDAVEKL